MDKILFIHGLASSGAYKMADILRHLLAPCELIAPDVPIEPDKAFAMLRELCATERPDLIVGHSLGGFWAQQLRGFRKALVNPDFHASALMRTMTGEVKYLSPRANGEESFIIDEALCAAYEEREKALFDGLDARETAITLGFFAESDELVQSFDEFESHYPGRGVRYPGGHLPTYPEIKRWMLPHLLTLLRETPCEDLLSRCR